MKIGNRVYLTFIVAGKFDKTFNDALVQPRFGRNWFYWLPYFKWNHGLPWHREVLDVGVGWLCFGIDFTLWPSWVNKPEFKASQAASHN